MVRATLIILSLFLLVSCGQNNPPAPVTTISNNKIIEQNQNPVSFTTIDFTVDNGSSNLLSVYIDSSKTIKIRIIQNKSKQYFIGTIPDSVFAKINLLAKQILQTKQLAGSSASGTDSYNLLLTSNNKVSQFTNAPDSCPAVKQLAMYLISYAKTSNAKSTDTAFVFNSYIIHTAAFFETIKFAPPIFKLSKNDDDDDEDEEDDDDEEEEKNGTYYYLFRRTDQPTQPIQPK